MRIFVGALGVALLAGCGSTPITASSADPVPSKRLFGFQQNSDSLLIVVRDGGMYGAGCNYKFFIDGKLAADFAAGEVAKFGIASGRHILSSTYSSACGGGSLVEREIDIKPGEVAKRRISVITGGAQDISPTAF